MLSKNASLNDSFKLERTNGMPPKIAILTQANVENKKAC
jgi:predicted nuclease of predicted toxin-antitoxin system